MTGADLFEVLAATWPSRGVVRIGGFAVPEPDAGGNRVSAARLHDAGSDGVDGLDAAETAMAAQGRAPLFQTLDHQYALETELDRRGYIARDHTDILVIAATRLAAVPPSVTAFDIWPPLAIQTEIWEHGGIDSARRDVMDRAAAPKTSIFGRISEKPAGSAFIGLHGDTAMLHALEIAPPLRRQGLAAVMMRKAADWAVENGATWLSVLVTQQNSGAQGLYASLGLRSVGTYRYREKQDR